jgi:hypothetical protein
MGVFETLERDRQARQVKLDEQRDQGERNQLGQFATPEALALQMVQLARQLWRPTDPVRFLDPAIGSGAFYSAVRRVFAEKQMTNASGVEIDPRFTRAARTLWSRTGLRVTEGDFTRLSPPPEGKRATLVLANPPYVRHHHLDAKEKSRLQSLVGSTLGVRISGLAGLYAYFILVSHRWMEPGALALWLVPSEFLDVNYGATLREYLRDRVTLLQLHRFDPADVQFSDALVSSAVLVFRAAPAPRDHVALFTYGGGLTTSRRRQEVQLRRLTTVAKWSSFPGRIGSRVHREGPRLSEFFAIKRGIATGANEFFILPRERARELRIPERFLRPILPSPRRLQETIIEALPDGYPRLEEQLALIDCTLAENQLQREAPAFLAYLKGGEEAGIRDRYLVTRRVPWYRQERRPPVPFLCTYMGRGAGAKNPFRFLWNKSQAIAANVYLLLYPIGAMKAALNQDPLLFARVFELLRSIDPERLRSEGRVYGGALHKLEPKELGQLPAVEFATLIPADLGTAEQLALSLPSDHD